jgi:ribonucleoside-diphosphate reductase alpha chain
MVLVGLLDGKPYEVFSGLAEHIEVPKKTKTGVLIKNGKKDGVATYNLKVPVGDDDSILFKDVVNLFENPTQGAFTRTISLALRHGIPVNFVVDQLQKDNSADMFAFARCIARVLKGYIPDGTKSTTEKKCKECGSDQVFYIEGCVTCASCGSSKCS